MNADGLKLTAYFGERERTAGGLLAEAMLDLQERHGVSAGVLLRGVEGYGVRHHLRTDRLLTLSEDLPALSVAVDERARIEALAEEVAGLQRRGLLTLERAILLDPGEPDSGYAGAGGAEVKLSLYLGRRDRIGGEPAFLAACEALRRHGVAGATALLGVDGVIAARRRRGRFFSLNSEVPVIVVAVGTERRIAAALAELAATSALPAATLERVRVCRRDGESIAAPEPPAGSDPEPGAWRKLTVYSSESAIHEGHPIHRHLVRRLRLEGAAGATAVRGIWGFHGDHEPHGDRITQLRRRAPIVTAVVDRPERIAAWFAIAAELTAERGLVTCEAVAVRGPEASAAEGG